MADDISNFQTSQKIDYKGKDWSVGLEVALILLKIR
jgi:hypothetical protein|tara:strand:- start:2171 stop:2278 length:108 start_codon:yes stop_codon:yes gene_type:complete